MTLTNRLLAFVLTSLALVLIAFAATVYFLARGQLHRQLDERAHAVLDTLCAAAEIDPEGLEWESKGRHLGFRRDGESPLWGAFDEAGRRLDGSSEAGDFPTAEGTAGAAWHVVRRTLRHPEPDAVTGKSADGSPRYRTLTFVAALPVEPVERTLRALLGSLVGGAAGLFALTGLLGRWWCRRALAPVAAMTHAAKSITAETLAERIPAPQPPDELRDLAGAFNGLLARVQDSYERQARFTSEASHQLRTPLAGLRGQLELALRRDRDPDEYRRVIGVAIGQAEQLHQIVEMLLFLARADGETRFDTLEAVDLRRWIETHLEGWSSHARFRDIALRPALGDAVPAARVHPALFGQAFQNLLDNAAKYSDPGTPIVVDVRAVGGEVIVSLEDRGRGIAAEELGRVFAPFYRSADASQSTIRGVGLGLAVARRIVASFGGSLGATSELGRGSTFAMRLPAGELP